MKHVIEVFDRHSEELLLSVEIPKSRHEELAKLMDWQTPEDEFDGYDLSPEQVQTLETWTGKILGDANHIVQLVCVD
ncbi:MULTISPECIES: hypothetical protein [unclassified Pseudomonas]|uniref:DUF7683 domain-containing protein n=1 Tax=unclassified Pseudomonas TaxID=196821 RepID=UPI0010126644|nr:MULTISPECIES: hypothetical protein [unclassified Pseudomonas]MDI3354230.1 hypothetical protein [Pseudomonas sp. UYIF39]QAY89923.1 hypothetical protein CUN63_08230 [Pseudomonas sp. ACM7]TFB36365.1 hypothetical protein E3W21_23645 [Pseudomonas sp. F01002]